MAADFTISQPLGPGSAPLNEDLIEVRTGRAISFTALAATGPWVWSIVARPTGSTNPALSVNVQVQTFTHSGANPANYGRWAMRLTDANGSRTIAWEVTKDLDGNDVGYGLAVPAVAERKRWSASGRGVQAVFERFRAAVIAALDAAGAGADLDPAGPLDLGTTAATVINMGRVAADVVTVCDSFAANADSGFSFESANGSLSVDVINTSLLNFEELDITCSNQAYIRGVFTKLLENELGEHSVTVDGDGILCESDEGVKFGSLGCTWADGVGTIVDAQGVHAARRTGDNAANILELRGGRASSGATGSTNPIGGHLRLGGGRALSPGTQLGGDTRITHGRHIADNSTAELAGYYGDATDDDWENKFWSIKRDAVSRWYLNVTGASLMQTTATMAFNAGGVWIAESGNGAYGYLYLAATAAQVYSPQGLVELLGPGATARSRCHMAADVTTTDATTTTIATLTMSTARPSFVRASVRCWDASMNVRTWDVRFAAKNIAGTASIVGTAVATEDGDAGLAACNLTIAASGATIRFRADGIAATTLSWSVTAWEER